MTKEEFCNRYVNDNIYIKFRTKADVMEFVLLTQEYGYDDIRYDTWAVVCDIDRHALCIRHNRLSWDYIPNFRRDNCIEVIYNNHRYRKEYR